MRVMNCGSALSFAPAPIVALAPIAHELLNPLQPDALRLVGDQLASGPTGRGDPLAQIDQRRLGHVDAKWTDRVVGQRGERRRGQQADGSERGGAAKQAPACGGK